MDTRIFSLICVVLAGMGQGVVAPRLPELVQGTVTPELTSGIAGTLLYAGVFLSTFFYGRAADRGGFHRLLGPGLFGYAATLLAFGWASTPLLLFGVRFTEGLCLSAVLVAADFALGRLSAAGERGRWLSYYGVALSVGLVLGPAISLVMGKVSARVPLILVAALAVCFGVTALRLRIAAVPDIDDKPVSFNPRALACGASYGAMEAALVAVFPLLAVHEFHIVPEYGLLAMIAAAVAGSLAWGSMSDRWGNRRVLRLLLAVMAIAFSALFFSPAAFAACAVSGVLAGGIYPVGFAWLLEDLPESKYGRASGAFSRAYGLGALLGPMAGGVAAQTFGARGLFGVFAVTGILMTVLLLWPVRAQKENRVETRRAA